MSYFSQDFIDFFTELGQNNHKDWFHSQKKRYEHSVKKPFIQLVDDLIEEISQIEADFDIEAKDCILRINRDIRFSKDKSPYNLHTTAFVSRGGRKNKSIPGIFMRLAPDMLGIMGGCFGPDKAQLAAIRAALIADPHTLPQLLQAPTFKEKFGELKGDKMKRIPKEYQAAAEGNPLILHKQFYFMAQEEATLITSDQLLARLMDYYHAMKPVNDYLSAAIA